MPAFCSGEGEGEVDRAGLNWLMLFGLAYI